MQAGNEICRQWLRGKNGCRYGLGCIYTHEKVPQICNDWMNGKCKFTDEHCAYIHNENVKTGLASWSDGTRCVRISSSADTGCQNFRDQIQSQLDTIIYDSIAKRKLLDKLVKLDMDNVRSILADKRRILNMAGVLQACKADVSKYSRIHEMEEKQRQYKMCQTQLLQKAKAEGVDLTSSIQRLTDAKLDVSFTETALSEHLNAINVLKKKLKVQQAHVCCVQKEVDDARKIHNVTMQDIEKQKILLEEQTKAILDVKATVGFDLTHHKEKAEQEDGEQCVICLSEEPKWAFVPCGHQCVCDSCRGSFDDDNLECVICRRNCSMLMRCF